MYGTELRPIAFWLPIIIRIDGRKKLVQRHTCDSRRRRADRPPNREATSQNDIVMLPDAGTPTRAARFGYVALEIQQFFFQRTGF
jgi:hypothetical protein